MIENANEQVPLAPVAVEERADRGVLGLFQDDCDPEETLVNFTVPGRITWT